MIFMKKKLKIGITGGIGAGKSLVSRYFEDAGFPVIKSDEVAKELLINDESVKKQIINTFGKSSYSADGVNSKFLAEQIFSDPEKNQKMNSIVHPPTTDKIDVITKKLFEENNIVFVESALIYEAEIEDRFDYVILVYSGENTCIERVMGRGSISEDEIRSRMAFQIPPEKKREWADFVIENNSSKEDLKSRSSFILTILKSLIV